MTIKKRGRPKSATPKIITSVSLDIPVREWFEKSELSLTKIVNTLPAKLEELERLRREVKDMNEGIKKKDALIIKQAGENQRLHEMIDRMRQPR